MEFLSTLEDPRPRRSIPLRNICIGAFIIVSSRLGSINALMTRTKGRTWKQYCAPGPLPSADQLGRIAARLPSRAIRRQIKKVYGGLKRGKALAPAGHDNLFSLVIDGHEFCSSYLRDCDSCLIRQIKTNQGERTQYYHRLVMGVLVCDRFTLLLDVEMQRKGEDEVAAATRLLERLLREYPRAFDLVLADGLYARAPFFKMIRKAGKHAIAVLKSPNRDLYGDVMGLCKQLPARNLNTSAVRRKVWDIETLNSWPSMGTSVRVVRSVETTRFKRQISGKIETVLNNWMWVTTIPKAYLATTEFIDVAHHRWDIENDAFNELVTYWHSSHVYKHDPDAMLVFWLLTMLAYNIFHAFYFLNIKPALRSQLPKYQAADLITAEFVLQQLTPRQRAP
jgi:hypothetical protein